MDSSATTTHYLRDLRSEVHQQGNFQNILTLSGSLRNSDFLVENFNALVQRPRLQDLQFVPKLRIQIRQRSNPT